MKNIITSGIFVTITFLSFALVGCSKTDTDIVRENVENYLERTLDDASSYEFVHLEYKEEITQRDNFDYRVNNLRESIDIAKETINREEASSFPNNSRIEESKNDIKRFSAFITELESFEEQLRDNELDETACYVYEFDFRASNPMGGIVLTNSYLYVTQNLEVVDLVTTGRMLNTCNIFEEHAEILRNIQRDY